MSSYLWYPMHGYGYPYYYGTPAWGHAPFDGGMDVELISSHTPAAAGDSPSSDDVVVADDDDNDSCADQRVDLADFADPPPCWWRDREWESLSDSAVYSARCQAGDGDVYRDDDKEYFEQLRWKFELLRWEGASSQDASSWGSASSCSSEMKDTVDSSSSRTNQGGRDESLGDVRDGCVEDVTDDGGESVAKEPGEGWASGYCCYGTPEQYMNMSFQYGWAYHPAWSMHHDYWLQHFWMHSWASMQGDQAYWGSSKA